MDDAAATSARIERLLEEVRATAGPVTWPRVDELVTSIVDLYGRALGRMLEAVEPAARRALADDELLGSLLALHALHPLSLEERIRQALDAAAPTFGALELVAIEGAHVRLRAADAPAVGGAAAAIERLVLEAAPEIERVEIDGLRERTPTKGPLVQIDLQRSRARANGG
jgi:hypothetical protein